jgi:hypothetical protein
MTNSSKLDEFQITLYLGTVYKCRRTWKIIEDTLQSLRIIEIYTNYRDFCKTACIEDVTWVDQRYYWQWN